MRACRAVRRAHLPGLLVLLAGAVGRGPAHKRPGRRASTSRTAPNASRASTAPSARRCGATSTAAARPPRDPQRPGFVAPGGVLIDTTWGFLADSKPAYVRLHQANYFLPARYTSDVNTAPYQPLFDAFQEDADFENVEARFQLSVKGRLLTTEDHRWGLWFAYSQQSQWQLYGEDISRPFRETNYMPEVFGSFRPGIELGGLQWNLLNFGYTHQSNGRAEPISRSWDRLFVEAGFERNDFVLLARAWTRIEPDDGEDDNPDIVDYLGHGEITAFYRWRDHAFSVMARGNLETGKGAAQFTWASPPVIGPLRGYLQVFTGYGETMIDYDWRQTTVGLGLTLNERF